MYICVRDIYVVVCSDVSVARKSFVCKFYLYYN